MVGPVVFVAVFTMLGAISPGYDWMRQFVSLLSLSEAGLVQTVSFLVTGALIISAAFGLRRVSAPGRGSRWAPIGIFLAGLGFIVAGLFPTDALQDYPPDTPLGLPLSASAHAAVHVSGALLFFVGLPVASIVMARRFASAGEPGWAAYSAASGVGMLLFNAATSASPGTVGMFPDVAGSSSAYRS
jgi:hypothetical membrane protein